MTNTESGQSGDTREPPVQQAEWLDDLEYPYTDHQSEIITEYTETGCPCEEENARLHYTDG